MIVHIISSMSRGGRERQLATIAANTDLSKYPTKIIYFNESNNSYIEEYNLTSICVRIKSKKYFQRLVELKELLSNYCPHIVYTWGNLESTFALFLTRSLRFKLINGSIRHGIRSYKTTHYFRTLVLHLSKFVVANSYAGLKANNLKKGKVLYNGIDEKFIGTLDPKEKQKRRCDLLKIDKNQMVLISVANLVPYKDYFSILKALQQIKMENHSFIYLILGDGQMRNEIINYVQVLELTNYVRIIGHVENVSDYLRISDIFIHSSKGEGCSNAILEAMAAGLPIIASDTGGTSEIVSNENGYLFEYTNHHQLENYINLLLTDSIKANQLGTYSLRKIQNDFTIQKMMNNYYGIIEEVLSK